MVCKEITEIVPPYQQKQINDTAGEFFFSYLQVILILLKRSWGLVPWNNAIVNLGVLCLFCALSCCSKYIDINSALQVSSLDLRKWKGKQEQPHTLLTFYHTINCIQSVARNPLALLSPKSLVFRGLLNIHTHLSFAGSLIERIYSWLSASFRLYMFNKSFLRY